MEQQYTVPSYTFDWQSPKPGGNRLPLLALDSDARHCRTDLG
jgi:hypothetical protein